MGRKKHQENVKIADWCNYINVEVKENTQKGQRCEGAGEVDKGEGNQETPWLSTSSARVWQGRIKMMLQLNT